MLSNLLVRVVSVVVVLAISAAAVGAWPQKQGQKAQVRFLATSTLVRGTWGWNEDTYLAELRFTAGGEPLLVRLADAYPNEWPLLSRKVLKADAGTVLPVRREAECDRPFGESLLRTAPGDPMAILPERLSYRPPLDWTPAPGTVLPCYRVFRR